MLLSDADRGKIISAHVAGDSARLISIEQKLDLSSVQQAIVDYEAEQDIIRAEWRQINDEAGLNSRKSGSIAQTDAQRVIQLYRETDLSTRQIATQLKLRVKYVADVISSYDAQYK